jgi:hypothetical protein
MSDWGDSEEITDLAEARRLLAQRLDEFRIDLSNPQSERGFDRIEVSSERIQALIGAAFLVLNAARDEKCTLDGKEPSDIHVRPEGPNGNLINRCEHNPSHCWSYVGERIDCPS